MQLRSVTQLVRALEIEPALALPEALADGPDPFSVVAAEALEAAGSGERPEAMLRLAGRLVEAERAADALNLRAVRQLTACLLAWGREEAR